MPEAIHELVSNLGWLVVAYLIAVLLDFFLGD
jgi:hypothetical protein